MASASLGDGELALVDGPAALIFRLEGRTAWSLAGPPADTLLVAWHALDGKEPERALITVDDRMHLGSCTKAFTATLAAVLVADGKPLGMDGGQWDALAKWMKAEGLVKTDVSGSGAIDTSLLPEASQ
jgi:hypothetical protein